MEEKVVNRHKINPYQKAEKDLLDFVSEQISLMNSHLLFSGKQDPGFYELNQSLMNYESVMLGLITLHAEVRLKFDIAKEEYDEFYAQKYVETKRNQIALGKSAEFTAQREIELFVRNNWITEISSLKANIITIENKYNLINHLIQGWRKLHNEELHNLYSSKYN